MWTKSLAVGSKQFVQKIQETLGSRRRRRALIAAGYAYVLREEPESYEANFTPENRTTGPNVGLLGGWFFLNINR
jgi:putative transposase